MDASTAIGALTAAVASGLGLGAGAKLIPTVMHTPRGLQGTDSETARQGRTPFQRPERKRQTSIVGLYQDLLRHADGSYTRGYDVPLQATMLATDEIADSLIDGFADMLTVDMPAGTVLQFRYAVGPDPGRAIAEHLRARDYTHTHFPASRLHDLNIDFLRAVTNAHSFRQQRASLFVRVPAKHTDDRSLQGFNSFVASMVRDWGEYGFKRLGKNWSNSRNDGIVRRICAIEAQSARQAEKLFRLVELESPVPLVRLDCEQLWRAVYQSHVLGSLSVPRLPKSAGAHLSNFLCAESIEDRGWYVMHGIYPVTIVSLFSPGEDVIAADAMRVLTAHPGLSFRHTIVTEFISLDREKAKSRLDSHIKHVERSGTRADGRRYR